MMPTKASSDVAVAASALLIDSVDGQRARPAAVMRFDLLKVVGSRPDALARPEADNLLSFANSSIADQTCACVSIRTPLSRPKHRNYCLRAQGPIGSRRVEGNAVTTIYKICGRPEWRVAEREGMYRGSDVDAR